MSSFKLNTCGDLDFTGGRLTLVSGADEIRQRWLVRVRTFKGEWFLDQEIGVPYVALPGRQALAVTEKLLTEQRLKEIYTRATLDTPGVLRVNAVIVKDFDRQARTATVEVHATIDADEDSQVFVFDGTCDTVPANAVFVGADLVVAGPDTVVTS